MHRIKQFIATYYPGLLLLLGTLLLGIATHRDYGVSWDEPPQRNIGTANCRYIFKGDQGLFTFRDKEYGPGLEIPLTMMEKAFNLDNTRKVFFTRHLVTHTFFLFSIFCGYVLVVRLFRSQWLACLAFVMLLLSPRIYAHSFFNTKDVPFLCMMLITFLAAHWAFAKGTKRAFLLLGAVVGYTTSIRIMGILPAGILAGFLVCDILFALQARKTIAKPAMRLLLLGAGWCLVVYATWPLLWKAPVQNFISCFNNMKHYGWQGSVLLGGQYYHSSQIPWYYFSAWFVITNPVLWLIAGVAGAATMLVGAAMRPLHWLRDTRERHLLVYFLCFFAPVLAVILLHSVVYDDWRHLFFVYPSFVLMGIYGLHKIHNTRWRTAVQVACLMQVAVVGWFMVSAHPFQQVYFNELVRKEPEYLRKNYELDYWGCGFKQGLEYLLKTDTSQTIYVTADEWAGIAPMKNNTYLLSPADSSRIVIVKTLDSADYFLTTYRMHPQDFSYTHEVYRKTVQNSTIFSIFKLR